MRSRQPCSGYPAPVPRRLWRAPGLASVLAPALALTLLSCGDGAEPPTAPQSAAQAPASTLATAVGGALLFRQVSAGDGHTCGVTTDDRAYCWGVTPAPVKGGLRFLEVSAGGGTTCGVTTTQRAYCWGGDLTPVEVPGGRHFRQVSVGLNYICGVNPYDVAFCWGDNSHGQLGNGGTSAFTSVPTRVIGGLRFRRVFTAATHTCGATTDDRAYCWGNNVFGQLGVAGSVGTNSTKPVPVAGGLHFRQVKPGSGVDSGLNEPELDTALSCGVTTDDRVYCWGNGAIGSAVGSSRTPVPVDGGRHYVFVHPGLFHACALNPFNVAFCWGSNEFGQLGTGSNSFSVPPARVLTALRFASLTVSTTGWHSCGVTTDNRAYCWGRNAEGQLGDGTHVNRPTPVAVVGPV